MGERLKQAKLQCADWLMAAIPRAVPDRQALQSCKIISHRGEHDNVLVMENTLPAFRIASDAGVWGIECDIRWTADLVPVIVHDTTGERVFGDSSPINRLPLVELRRRMPQVPTLEELVADLGGRVHLMLELKAEPFPRPVEQGRILQRQLSTLTPGEDYHLLGLDPTVFELTDFLPRRFCHLVAEENVAELLQVCLDGGYGGLGGHFLLLNNRVKHQLEAVGRRIGTGFVASRNCLFRELNRGVEWIFSNDAVKINAIRNRYLTT